VPDQSSPGVYVRELPSGLTPIQGASTSISGFVGAAERGPTSPVKLTSWTEFREVYGDPIPESFLAYAVEGFFANGGEVCHVARVRASDGSPNPTLFDYAGDAGSPTDQRTGLAALDRIDSISILSVPDEVRLTPADLTPLTELTIEQCERRRDRFCIASIRQGQSDVALLPPRPDSSRAALYYPWIRVLDPVTEGEVQVPPAGHVAGIFARTDVERGVHRAPANEVVRGALGLEFPVTQQMQDLLGPLGVNALRDFDGRGIRLWGARTLASDPEWRYVNVRRLATFLEKSIDTDTRWVVFEPNAEPLWARVRDTIAAFLVTQWRNGALQGATPDEAFFVRCDRSTMTQGDIDNGRLVCLLGFAPLRPAEFVIVRIHKTTAGSP